MRKIFLFFILFISTIQANDSAILQGSIHLLSVDAVQMKSLKIQPGTNIRFKAEVLNSGSSPSSEGSVYIRQRLIEPMNDILENRTFQTEIAKLPVIYPGRADEITFTTFQTMPSLIDFFRQNWNMRHYELVIKIADKEEVIGYLPLLVSAHYYEGPGTKKAVEINIQ